MKKILDSGYIKLIETWGSDERIIEAARCGGVERYASGDCAACARAREKARYAANRPRIDAKHALWRKANSTKHNAASAKWARENPEKQKVRVARWAAANKTKRIVSASASYLRNRVTCNIRSAKWMREHPEYASARVAIREASKLQATPSWANDFFIKEAYALAALRSKMFGFKWHVDHIVPLRSKTVCGLHVEHNLQVIPAVENMAKSNRTWPDKP